MSRADLIVLGGGLGGLACARRSAELGARVVLVDAGDWRDSQAFRSLLPQTLLAQAIRGRGDLDAAALFRRFQSERDAKIATAWQETLATLEQAGVERINSRGWIETLTPRPVVATNAGTFSGERLALAVGARLPSPPWVGPGSPVLSADRQYLWDDPLPERLAVVGGGYIAIGVASTFRALGVDVVMVFAESEPLDGLDEDLRREVGAALVRSGIRLRPETVVHAVTGGERRQALETSAGLIAADPVVVAASTRPIPNTTPLELERFEVPLTRDGAVYVDSRYASRVANLFAIGDCTDHAGQGLDPSSYDWGPVAEAEGLRLAEALFGTPLPALDYDRVPLAVDGPLAIGSLGFGTERARSLGIDVADVPLPPLPAERFTKMVVDAASGRVLGCHLCGEGAALVVNAVADLLSKADDAGALAAALEKRGDLPAPFVQELVAQARAVG